jgi:hypothetical protein
MSKGQDTAGHPGRQVGPHLSQHWRQSSGTTGPMGAQTHSLAPNDAGISASVWQGPAGYHAEVQHQYDEAYGGGYGGISNSRYVVGPLRTEGRALRAAEAGANRVEAGKDMSKYESGSYTDTVRNPRYPRT